jgi:hypothetical protein
MANDGMNLAPVQEVAIDGPVAQQILVHLVEEKTTLEAMLKAVRDVHHALIHLDDHSLKQSLEIEARELNSSLAIQQRRLQLQGELASVLHLAPQEITLNRLVTMMSGALRESTDQIWKSLIEMANEIDRLNRQNAALIGQSLSIVRGVIERLSGVSGVGESYDASGGRADTHVGPLLQWGA